MGRNRLSLWPVDQGCAHRFPWAWAPAYDWAPAWVAWRYADADGYMGWAPLPWEARYEVGVGLTFRGGLALDIDFGLGMDAFVFVGRDHFWEHDYRGYMVGPGAGAAVLWPQRDP